MSTTFTVSISLGNATMATPEDVADALETIVAKLRYGYQDGRTFDANGNTVGTWGADEWPDVDADDVSEA